MNNITTIGDAFRVLGITGSISTREQILEAFRSRTFAASDGSGGYCLDMDNITQAKEFLLKALATVQEQAMRDYARQEEAKEVRNQQERARKQQERQEKTLNEKPDGTKEGPEDMKEPPLLAGQPDQSQRQGFRFIKEQLDALEKRQAEEEARYLEGEQKRQAVREEMQDCLERISQALTTLFEIAKEL